MRIAKLLIVLIGVAAAGPALAGPPDDFAAATSVTILRGSNAPPEPYTPPPREVVREVVYLPAYYPPDGSRAPQRVIGGQVYDLADDFSGGAVGLA